MRWNYDQVLLLRQMWGEFSGSEIAQALGSKFSREAVIGKAWRLGLSTANPEQTSKERRESHRIAQRAVVEAARVMWRP